MYDMSFNASLNSHIILGKHGAQKLHKVKYLCLKLPWTDICDLKLLETYIASGIACRSARVALPGLLLLSDPLVLLWQRFFALAAPQQPESGTD